MAGYSGKSLIDKLGIKPDFKVVVINPPTTYEKELGTRWEELGGKHNFIQFFTKSRKELEKEFPKLMKHLFPSGMLWVSWPKGSSKMETDLNENIIREIGLKNGMVDVKVIAVDEVWSGLKFVFKLKDRKSF